MLLNTVIPTINLHFSSDKSNPEIGLGIAQWIDSWLRNGYNDYYSSRQERFQNNRLWAEGREPMTQFMDLMQINGQSAYVNLDFTPPAIMNKYIQQIMDLFMSIDEDPIATAIDKRSNRKKIREKQQAEFRMRHAQEIAQIQQASGVPLEDPQKFTPKDKDELELYFSLEYKLPEEALVEILIKNIFDENKLSETKRLVLRDLIICGLGVTRSYKDTNGQICHVRIRPEDFFYSYCEYPDFRDAAFMGEVVNMKVTDFRRKFAGKYTENQIFEMAMQYGQAIRKENLSWIADYNYMYYRPYDDWTLPCIRFEVKTDSSFFVKKKTTRSGTPVVDFSKDRPERVGYNTTIDEKNLDQVYVGWWLRGSSEMLEWGVSDYDIRPPDNLSQQFFTYNPYLYDGFEMRNVAIPERIRPSVFQMILAHLRIQQLMAKMRPAGVIYDIHGLNNIDMGDGHTLTPLRMQAYFQQTGDYYWDSVGEDGETRMVPPVQAAPNNEAISQMQSLIEIYNFYLERLQADLGTNPVAAGQGVNPRMGLGVLKQQLRSASSSVSNIYDAWLNIADQMATKTGIMAWDDIVYDIGVYKKFIDPTEKIDTTTYFCFKMEMLPDDAEREYVEQMVQTALSAGIIDFEQAFKVRNISERNTKLASLYLGRMSKAAREAQQQQAMQQMQMNQQVQAASLEAKAQGDMAVQQAKSAGKIIEQQADSQNKKEQLLQQFVQQALLDAQKTGVPIDPYTKHILEQYFGNNLPALAAPEAPAAPMGQSGAQEGAQPVVGVPQPTAQEAPM